MGCRSVTVVEIRELKVEEFHVDSASVHTGQMGASAVPVPGVPPAARKTGLTCRYRFRLNRGSNGPDDLYRRSIHQCRNVDLDNTSKFRPWDSAAWA